MTRRSLTRGKPRGFGNNGLMRRIWACESRNGLGIGYLRPPQNHTTPSRVKGPEPRDAASDDPDCCRQYEAIKSSHRPLPCLLPGGKDPFPLLGNLDRQIAAVRAIRIARNRISMGG